MAIQQATHNHGTRFIGAPYYPGGRRGGCQGVAPPR
jgi:hypothetical protein